MKRFNCRKNIVLLLVIIISLLFTAGNVKAVLYIGDPVNPGPNINTSSVDIGPVVTVDGCTMYFSSDRPGGYGGWDIYVSTRESKNDNWGPAVNIGPTINDVNNEIVGSISPDGQSLYLHSDRPGGYGSWDLWVTTWTEVQAQTGSYFEWCTPVNLGETLNRSSDQIQPVISSDGLSLYYSSNQTSLGGFGGADLWVTTRATTSSSWDTPVNLGKIVNSPYGDYQPSISTDNLTLFFTSTRQGGYGPDDIYVTTRASIFDPWGPPVNLGPKINTPAEDFNPNISSDGFTLYFTSSGHGGYGFYDIFEAPIFSVPTCGDLNHPYPTGDFNKDCRVDDYDILIFFIDHWLDCTAPECDEAI